MDTSGNNNKDGSAHETTSCLSEAVIHQHDTDEVHCIRLEIAEVQASLVDIQNKATKTREIGIPVDIEIENRGRSTSTSHHLLTFLNHSITPSGIGLSYHRVPVDNLPPSERNPSTYS
ncbi:hypothetical protein SNE40_019879 [Patella caerulea]|uniref:Uncharacterized protein n=1 Tax=Patella caerulea TaxID=87958 RepID=A0AAN8GJP8_PATCE